MSRLIYILFISGCQCVAIQSVTVTSSAVNGASSYNFYVNQSKAISSQTTNGTITNPPPGTNQYNVTAVVGGIESGLSSNVFYAVPDTNNYVWHTNVFLRHVRPLIGNFTLSTTNWQFILWFTNDDVQGAITALKPFLAWGAEATNWPVATNVWVETNPPPYTGSVQPAMALLPFK